MNVYCVSLILHGLFLAYGQWFDAKASSGGLRYTDIDYQVFTDAAANVFKGKSPYSRHTYRYTPLLAYLMVPNVCLTSLWGKSFFAAINLVLGAALEKLLPPGCRLHWIWLLNVFAIQIATRGSADCVPAALSVLTLLFLRQRKWALAGLLFGLAVHFKIYPVIYSLPLIFEIYPQARSYLSEIFRRGERRSLDSFTRIICHAPPQVYTFGLTSLAVFFGLLLVFYRMYGYEFLYQTYLYHGGRVDHRHNFSPLFPLQYALQYFDSVKLGRVLRFASLLQFALVLLVGWILPIELSLFLQTLLFVAFNRVFTSQYFVWWQALLPLALQHHRRDGKWRSLFLGTALWICAQAAWLYYAYQLEFRGVSVFVELGLSGGGLLLAHVYICQSFLQSADSLGSTVADSHELHKTT